MSEPNLSLRLAISDTITTKKAVMAYLSQMFIVLAL